MKFNTIDDLKAAGFEGFIPVAQLQTDSTAIPRTAGVYMVVYTGENMSEFLSRGTGGFFKGKDPNVSITELETNWVKKYMCGLHRKSRNNPPKTIKSISEIREWTKYRALGRPIHLANKKFRQFAVVLETYSRRRSRSDRNRTHRPIQRTARGTQTIRQSQRLKAEGISMQSQGKCSTLP